MKIGINARFLTEPYTGIGKYTYSLLRALSKIDPVNDYILFTPELAEITLPDNFKQIRVPEKDYRSASMRKAHWEQKLVPEAMLKWEVDLAHFLYPSNPNKKLDIPTVVTVHDAIPWKLSGYQKKWRSKLYHANAKRALKKADHLITVSHFSKKEIQSIIDVDDKNITVTHLAVPQNAVRDVPTEVSLRRKYLLYVGGYDLRKNIPLLMIAYQKFIANVSPIDLILVGAKGRGLERFLTDEFVEKIASKVPVKPKGRIIFTEHLSDHHLVALYSNAVAMVHPSIYEGFNLPLVEAMSHHLPMAVADIPVNHEVAGDAAFYLDPKDENTFGLGLHKFLNDRKCQKELIENAKIRKNQFEWSVTAQKTMEIYRRFIS